MSEKRSGGRDISELKARLGLKKGGAAPAPGRAHSQTGGVAPPPGVVVQPPPGARGHQPPMPNAADDPFGAMSAMAQAGQAQRAPEIVINVNEGPPAEHVGASKRIGGILKWVGIALVPLIVGMLVGAAGRSAAHYNEGTKGAKAIVSHVTVAKRGLGKLQSILDDAKKKGLKPDKALSASLKPLVEELKPDTTKIYAAKQGTLGAELSNNITTFFASVAQVQQMLEEHQRTAAFDDAALVTAADAMKAATMKETENAAIASMATVYPYRYGIVLSNPSATDPTKKKPFGAQIIEIGQPYCNSGQLSTSGVCPDGIAGFGYRDAMASSWAKGDLASVAPDALIPTDKIVPLLPSQIADGLVKGPGPTAAEAAYIAQLTSISKRLEEVITAANELETKLNQKAKVGDKFTFFM